MAHEPQTRETDSDNVTEPSGPDGPDHDRPGDLLSSMGHLRPDNLMQYYRAASAEHGAIRQVPTEGVSGSSTGPRHGDRGDAVAEPDEFGTRMRN